MPSTMTRAVYADMFGPTTWETASGFNRPGRNATGISKTPFAPGNGNLHAETTAPKRPPKSN